MHCSAQATVHDPDAVSALLIVACVLAPSAREAATAHRCLADGRALVPVASAVARNQAGAGSSRHPTPLASLREELSKELLGEVTSLAHHDAPLSPSHRDCRRCRCCGRFRTDQLRAIQPASDPHAIPGEWLADCCHCALLVVRPTAEKR